MSNGTPPTPTATPPAAPGTSPTGEGTAATTTPGPNNQLALFNRQMYLIDKFAQDSASPALGGPKVSVNNVPAGNNFANINDLVTQHGAGMFSWLHNIRPDEYAQLIPHIGLFYVNIDTDAQTPIPLSGPSDLRGGLAATEHFYTTKTVGLKSLEMKIDGNTTPVSGKIYNISLSLIWDSLNTFFSTIPGGSKTYADVFRSQGQAAGATYEHKLKLSISYTGPSDIMTTYSLEGQAFTVYLDLIKSKLSVKENLLTQVDATFIGFEESMLGNLRLFDFLHLDLESIMAKNTARRDAAATALSRDTMDAQAKRDAAKAAHLRQLESSNIEKQLVNLNAYETTGMPNTVDAAQLARGAAIVGALQASGYSNINVVGSDSGPMVQVAGNEPVPLRKFQMDAAQRRTVASTMHNHYSEGKDLSQIDGFRTIEGLTSLGPESGVAAALRKADADYTTELASLTGEHARENEAVKADLQNVRMGQINEALLKTVFGHPEAFHEIKLTTQQFEAYIESILTQTTKNYFDAEEVENTSEDPSGSSAVEPAPAPDGSGLANQAGGAATPAPPADDNWVGADDVTTPSGTPQPGSSASHTKLTAITTTIRDATAAKERAQATIDSTSPTAVPDVSTAAGSLGVAGDALSAGLATAARRMQAERALEEANQTIAAAEAERAAITQNSSVLGSVTEIETELNTSKKIEYIFLGDLLGLVIKRLIETADDDRAKNHITKTFIFLTKIAIKQIPFGPDDQIKNLPLYKLPVDILQLQKLFSDRLRGTLKNTFTLFELIQEIIKIVGLSQKRKGSLLHKTINNPFTLKSFPVAMDAGALRISTAAASSMNVDHGIILTVSDLAQNTDNLRSTYSSNQSKKIPHFFFGGYSNGAVKSIEIAEVTDDLAKVAFSRLQGSASEKGAHLPALFEVTVKLIGTPFFQVGMLFYLSAPTINMSGVGSWLFLEGYYAVKALTHSYTAGGQYETVIEGRIQWSQQAGGANADSDSIEPVSAADANGALQGTTTLPTDSQTQRAGEVPVGIPEPTADSAFNRQDESPSDPALRKFLRAEPPEMPPSLQRIEPS